MALTVETEASFDEPCIGRSIPTTTSVVPEPVLLPPELSHAETANAVAVAAASTVSALMRLFILVLSTPQTHVGAAARPAPANVSRATANSTVLAVTRDTGGANVGARRE